MLQFTRYWTLLFMSYKWFTVSIFNKFAVSITNSLFRHSHIWYIALTTKIVRLYDTSPFQHLLFQYSPFQHDMTWQVDAPSYFFWCNELIRVINVKSDRCLIWVLKLKFIHTSWKVGGHEQTDCILRQIRSREEVNLFVGFNLYRLKQFR